MLRRYASPEGEDLPDEVSTLKSRVTSLLSVAPRIAGSHQGRPGQDADSAPPGERGRTKAERIHRVLDRNGGRIYQKDVVEATDWSKAMVSRVLCELERTGEVARFRIGRQKVVCYPEYLPERAKNDSEE